MDVVVFFKVSEVVIGFTMADFVGPDGKDHVPEGGVRSHVVVLNRCRWCLLCGELWQLAPINLLDEFSVSMDGLFFQVTNEPVAKAGRDQIHREVYVCKEKLCCSNKESESISRLTLLGKEKQMHPFIFCLF